PVVKPSRHLGEGGLGFARTRSARCRRSEAADGGQAAAGKAAHASHTAATGRARHRPQGSPSGVTARAWLHPRRFASQGLTKNSPCNIHGHEPSCRYFFLRGGVNYRHGTQGRRKPECDLPVLPGQTGDRSDLRRGALSRSPVKPGPDVDLTKATTILEEQHRQREDKFADSFFQETHKEDILAKKFEEAMKKAKDAPAGKPIRDFDLD